MEDNVRICMTQLQVEPILLFPDFNKKFTLTTNTSEYALGAVLLQEGTEGECPVAYARRWLMNTETPNSCTWSMNCWANVDNRALQTIYVWSGI